ncbi:hypothetical protein GCM10027072_37680 [Streptomyces bullii]
MITAHLLELYAPGSSRAPGGNLASRSGQAFVRRTGAAVGSPSRRVPRGRAHPDRGDGARGTGRPGAVGEGAYLTGVALLSLDCLALLHETRPVPAGGGGAGVGVRAAEPTRAAEGRGVRARRKTRSPRRVGGRYV